MTAPTLMILDPSDTVAVVRIVCSGALTQSPKSHF